IGIVLPRCDSSCWRAGPLMPGMATSTTRQSVWSTDSEARNSAAEEKARDAKPNVLSRSGRDSRTDSSSSTTDTSGALGTRFSHHELPVVDRSEERRVGKEWRCGRWAYRLREIGCGWWVTL